MTHSKTSKTPARKHNRKNAIMALFLAATLLVTGAFAYLTDKDSATNVFTVGDVAIDLTEPSWDEENGKDMWAGKIIDKDPQIENTGDNDAFIYAMVTVPKADGLVVFDEIKGTATVDDYQLFTYDLNAPIADPATNGWTLIDSKIEDNDANNYYLYAYNTALAPGDTTVPVFNKITFANIVTNNNENDPVGNPFIDPVTKVKKELNVKIDAYAIQSNFGDGTIVKDPTDPSKEVWKLYVNQNGWTFPSVAAPLPEGMTQLDFVAESGEVVHTEVAAAGTPVEMYFEPSLAKDGYTFDWTDEATNTVAYSGMPMPEENTTLTATYTETGYGENTSDFLIYDIHEEDNGFYASVRGLDTSNPNCPTGPSTIIIPSQIEVTKVAIPDGSVELQSPNGKINAYFRQGSALALLDDVQDTFVATVNSIGALEDPNGLIETLVVADTVTNIDGVKCGVDKLIKSMKKMVLPYGVETIAESTFMSYTPLTEITLPASLTAIGNDAFKNCTNLTTINSDLHSVISLGTYAFAGCRKLDAEIIINGNMGVIPDNAFTNTNVKIIEIENGITRIESNAFSGVGAPDYINGDPAFNTSLVLPDSVEYIGPSSLPRLSDIVIPSSVTYIGDGSMQGDLTDIYYKGTVEQWSAISKGYNEALSTATIHYNFEG